MPRYDYQCLECDAVVELTSTFADADAARTCENRNCGGELRRLLSTPPTLVIPYSERFLNRSENPAPRPGLQNARRFRYVEGKGVVEDE
jgi:putative FmdB family regulatory protein